VVLARCAPSRFVKLLELRAVTFLALVHQVPRFYLGSFVELSFEDCGAGDGGLDCGCPGFARIGGRWGTAWPALFGTFRPSKLVGGIGIRRPFAISCSLSVR
jgi:hypothetical protein